MNTVILYYTFGGASMAEAKKRSMDGSIPVYRIREAKRRSLFTSFFPGCFWAMKRKPSKIVWPDLDLEKYDNIEILCPVWASFPAPAFNAIIERLPEGKNVSLVFVSGGGSPLRDEPGTIALVEKMACRVVSVENIKTGKAPSRLKE